MEFLSIITGYLLPLVGLVAVLRVVLEFVQIIYIYFLAPATNYAKYGSKEGAWAVVTGSSDGIGKSFAEILAKKGFNIVLISRTESKLKEVAQNIEKNSSVKTKILAFDFASRRNEDWEKVASVLEGLNIGVLVNNVGYNLEYPEYFVDTDLKRNMDILEVNVTATTRLTYMVLKNMLTRKKSLVLNIGSLSGYTPTPLLCAYSASKTYVEAFSKILYAEYKSKGVDVECLIPAFIVSNMSKRSRPSFTVPLPHVYVNSALRTVGQKWVRAGFFAHELMLFALSLVPERFFIWKNKDMHVGIRKAYFRKQERLNREKSQ